MLETRTLEGPDGRPFDVHLALPPSSTPAPGLVLIHEWRGLTPEIDRMAAQFAGAGFVVAAVDLYDGQVADDDGAAMALMQKLNSLDAAAKVRVAARMLAESPRTNGRVGVLGFCMGGAITFVCACHVPEAQAFAPFYGVPMPKYVDWARTHGPIEAHFARVDGFADPAKGEAIVAAVNAAGGRATLHVYEGGHAFMRASDPAVYHPESASLAFARSTRFFHEALD